MKFKINICKKDNIIPHRYYITEDLEPPSSWFSKKTIDNANMEHDEILHSVVINELLINEDYPNGVYISIMRLITLDDIPVRYQIVFDIYS